MRSDVAVILHPVWLCLINNSVMNEFIAVETSYFSSWVLRLIDLWRERHPFFSFNSASDMVTTKHVDYKAMNNNDMDSRAEYLVPSPSTEEAISSRFLEALTQENFANAREGVSTLDKLRMDCTPSNVYDEWLASRINMITEELAKELIPGYTGYDVSLDPQCQMANIPCEGERFQNKNSKNKKKTKNDKNKKNLENIKTKKNNQNYKNSDGATFEQKKIKNKQKQIKNTSINSLGRPPARPQAGMFGKGVPVTVNVPALDRLLNRVDDLSEGIAATKTDLMEGVAKIKEASFDPLGLLSSLTGKLFGDKSSVFVLAIAISILISTYPDNRTLRVLRSIVCIYLVYTLYARSSLSDPVEPEGSPGPARDEVLSVLSGLMDLINPLDLENVSVDMEEIPQATPQIGMEGIRVMSKTVVLFFTGFTGMMPTQRLLRMIMDLMKTTETQTANVSTLLATVLSGVSKVFLSLGASNVAKFFEVQAVADPKVRDYVDNVDSFSMNFVSGTRGDMTEDFSIKLNALVESGTKLFNASSPQAYERRAIDRCLRQLYEIRETHGLMVNVASETRQETLGVLFRGAPGTCKTTLSEYIAYYVLPSITDKAYEHELLANPKQLIYRVPHDKFFDGYNPMSVITTYDDIFTKRDVVGAEDSDAARIVNMINTAPYPLRMADASSKNKFFYRSKLLLATTNLMSFSNLESVTDYKAIERRFALTVDVSLHPDFTKEENGKQVLDVSKLPYTSETGSRETYIPPKAWTLQVSEHTNGGLVSLGDMTVEELSSKIEAMVKNRENYYKGNSMQNTRLMAMSMQRFLERKSSKEEIQPQGGFVVRDYDSFMKSLDYLHISYDKRHLYMDPNYEKYRRCFTRILQVMKNDGRLVLVEKAIRRVCHDADRAYQACAWIDTFQGGFFHVLYQAYADADEAVETLKRIEEQSLVADSPEVPYAEEFERMLKQTYMTTSERFIYRLTGLRRSFSWLEREVKGFYDRLTVGSVMKIGLLIGCTIPLGMMLGQFFSGFLKPLWNVLGAPVAKEADVKLADVDIDWLDRWQELRFLREPGPQSALTHPEIKNALPMNDNCADAIAKILRKYAYTMFLVADDGTMKLIGTVYNLQSQIYLMQYHFILGMHDWISTLDPITAGKVTLTFSPILKSNNPGFRMFVDDFINSLHIPKELVDKDLAMFRFKGTALTSKGCKSCFVKEQDLKIIASRSSAIDITVIGVSALPDSNIYSVRTVNTRCSTKRMTVKVKSNWASVQQYVVPDTIHYEGTYRNGDCGNMVTLTTPVDNRVVVGLHIAGSHLGGYATTVTQELLDRALEGMDANVVYSSDSLTGLLVDEEVRAHGCHWSDGKLKPQYATARVQKTELMKSPFFNKLSDELPKSAKVPGRLRPFLNKDGELIDPYQKAFDVYVVDPPCLNSSIVDVAVNDYAEVLETNTVKPRVARRLLTVDEALHSYERMGPVNPSSSGGFPGCVPGQYDFKKDYYRAIADGDIERFNKLTDELRTTVTGLIAQMTRGERPSFLYVFNNKDEKVSKERNLIGKTRGFGAGPFYLVILFRMYFGDFCSQFLEAGLKVGSGVGLNPYASWDDLARYLLNGERPDDVKMGAGDYSSFDARQYTVVHNAILDMILNWYGGSDEETRIRIYLWTEVVRPRFEFGGHVVTWFAGLPSGFPLTLILNTIVNHINFRMCWILCDLDIGAFRHNVRVVVVGDDNVYSISDYVDDVFNEITLPGLMMQIGAVFTAETKAAAIKPFRTLFELEFLKRRFVYDAQRAKYIGPLSIHSIVESVYWMKKGREGKQACLDAAQTAIREGSLHDRSIFEALRDGLLAVAKSDFRGYQPSAPFPVNHSITRDSVLHTSDEEALKWL